MESMQVKCPACGAMLTVPTAAGGKRARCPACHETFCLPTEKELLEEQVSSWIEEDLDDLQEETDAAWRQRLVAEEKERQARLASRDTKTAERLGHVVDPSQVQRRPTPPVPGERPQSPVSGSGSATETDPRRRPDRPQSKASADQPDQGSSSQSAGGGEQSDQAAAGGGGSSYPTDLLPTSVRPYLVVDEVSQEGVKIAFHSRWLNHEAFRRSMPVACVFSGSTKLDRLIAKPMAFIDQSQGGVRNPQTIEAGHEQRLFDQASLHSLYQNPALLEGMPPPYNRYLPYFVSDDNKLLSMECGTRPADDGFACVVLVPFGEVAVHWVERVNGRCGPEYTELQREVARLWGGAWMELPEETRQRLGAWAAFKRGERFLQYIRDGEFGRTEDGLAGIIITDRRVIYHRYHRRGEFDVDDQTVKLVIRPDADMAAVRVRDAAGARKALRLHVDDVPKLIAMLKEVGRNPDVEI